MNHDEDEALFQRALEASTPDVDVPPGFSERVLALAAKEPSARPWSRWTMPAGLAAAALLALAWGYANRRIEGVLVVRDVLREVRLGDRAVAVLSPGTSGHFAVGGLFGESDALHLDHGSAFLRVESGGPFSVITTEGEVEVLGNRSGFPSRFPSPESCFEVTRMEEDMSQVNAVRGRWFGAGAIAMGMAVAVYEGSVHVSRGHADAGEGVTLHAGERAALDTQGVVHRPTSSDETTGPASPAAQPPREAIALLGAPRAATSLAEVEALAQATRAENVRLRAMLDRHSISPETGEFLPNARRGLDEAGNTDLTAEEWSTLADRGELRFRLPGNESGGIGDRVRASVGLSEEEAARLNETVRGGYRGLMSRVGEAYEAATGRAADGRSLAVMMSEIEDHTAADEAAHVRWMLSQERAGRTTTPSAPMSEYERMMRELVRFEGSLEEQAAAQIGEERAHRLLYENSAHSFGMTGQPREGAGTAPTEAP